MSQYLMVVLFLMMPMEITATNDIDLEQIRADMIQMEIDTRALRQRRSGRGL